MNPYKCIQCGGNKVEKKKLRGLIFLTGLGTMSIGLWLFFIPIIHFIGIALLIAGGIFTLISPFAQPVLVCHDCNRTWNPKYHKPKKAVRP